MYTVGMKWPSFWLSCGKQVNEHRIEADLQLLIGDEVVGTDFKILAWRPLFPVHTVKRLYFAGRIFREFRESAFIREINFQRKLIHHHVISIFTYSYVQYAKWRCTSKTLPVHGSLSVRMPSEAVFSAKREMSGLVHQNTGQNSKTINTIQSRYASLSATKSLSSLIVSQSLSRRYDSMCWARSIRPIMEA